MKEDAQVHLSRPAVSSARQFLRERPELAAELEAKLREKFVPEINQGEDAEEAEEA